MQKFHFSILLVFLLVVESVSAQSKRKDSLKPIKKIEVTSLDSTAANGYRSVLTGPKENLDDIFAEKIDSLFNSWYIKNTFAVDYSKEEFDSTNLVSLPDSVYINRLQAIDSYIDLSYNKTVKNFIELYTQKRRDQVEVMLGLARFYFPMIEKQLDKYNLPMELKYLPIIESALNPEARSRANAVGLWQFMYGTGKMYHLKIGTFVDERCDPVKSTEAAAKYLSDLYKIYKNWHLVIAAYNCGPGNVNKAIRRSGGARNYWSIYYYLPRETRGYVPAFIAAAYVMNYYQKHNLHPKYPDFPLATDTIHIDRYVNFKQISATIKIPVTELKALNPQYRMGIIPGRPESVYALRIPIDKVADFIDNEQDIYAYQRDKFFPNNRILIPKGRNYYHSNIAGKDRVYYKVKAGDNLGFIAEWFHTRTKNLRYWNHIHHNMIHTGQKLIIYVPRGQSDFYADITNMTFHQKQAHAKKKPVTRSVSASASDDQISYESDFVYYTVRRGDNLWTIARKFPGVSNHDIKQWNNMQDNTIKPGQKLKIVPRG